MDPVTLADVWRLVEELADELTGDDRRRADTVLVALEFVATAEKNRRYAQEIIEAGRNELINLLRGDAARWRELRRMNEERVEVQFPRWADFESYVDRRIADRDVERRQHADPGDESGV